MSQAFLVCCAALALSLAAPIETRAATFDVKAFGAKGDGKTPDRAAINKAIDAAEAAGGGTVCFPAGTYLTGSIRLRSNITLQLEHGTVIQASTDVAAYDAAEPNQAGGDFQDFGHSHWHNSLIWGDGLENVAIVGGGLTLDQVAKQPADLVNNFSFRAPGGAVPPRDPFDTPEQEKHYPEPSMFGMLPAYGFFIRHAKGVELNSVEVGFMQEDRRPAFVLDQVVGADFQHVKAQKATGVSTLVLKNVQNFTARECTPLPDMQVATADRREM